MKYAAVVIARDPNDARRVLTVVHPERGGVEFPGGKLEPGESFPGAARRECMEETGIEVQIGRPLALGVVPAHDAKLGEPFYVAVFAGTVDKYARRGSGEPELQPAFRLPEEIDWSRQPALVRQAFEAFKSESEAA